MQNLEDFKAECQAFIFNWHKTSENAKKLQKQFSDFGIETYVINSHEAENNNGLDHWVHIGESSFMVKQYAKAQELFNKTYFIELFADIYNVNVRRIAERAHTVFSNYNCGIYAPDIYWTHWTYDSSRLPKLEKNLYEVKNPESLLSIIHKDVLSRLSLNPEKFKFGWGIDFLLSVHSGLLGKLVVRDYSVRISHPKGTGYDAAKAETEYDSFIADLGDDLAGLMNDYIAEAKNLHDKRFLVRVRNRLIDLKRQLGPRLFES